MSYTAKSMTIYNLMSDLDQYYLPAIQRKLVWPADKMLNLFDSLLRGYPIGTFLRWDVREPAIHEFQFYKLIRNHDPRRPQNEKADLTLKSRGYGILDGQQRITSLYIGLLGSRRDKLPRLWWDNPDAFPERKLYMNLLFPRESSDGEEKQYQLKFLTDAELKAQSTEGTYWYRVGDILRHDTRDKLRAFRRSTPHTDNDTFEANLDDLWNSIYEHQSIIYFDELRQDLDDVLLIFVRLNTGGTPLSYSDLLLSLATATWKGHDAREEVDSLVEDLNKLFGATNFFNSDFVLKSLLVLNDGDVRFRAVNIRRRTSLENIWEGARAALKITVRLARTFGLNWHSLTASNALIPVAYFIFKRGLSEGFLTSKNYEQERETIRIWLLKMLLGRVFSGQSDQVLSGVRERIRMALATEPASGFPAQAIQDYLTSRGTFAFNEQSIAALVASTTSGARSAFGVLALLFPYLDYSYTTFHVDHMHPASAFTRGNLKIAGMAPEEVEFALGHYDILPNLQLLTETENTSKQDRPFAEWLGAHSNPQYMKMACLVPDTDLSLRNFRDFYEARQTMLVEALKEKLGIMQQVTVTPTEVADTDYFDDEEE